MGVDLLRSLLRSNPLGRAAAPLLHRLRAGLRALRAGLVDRTPRSRAVIARLDRGLPLPPPRLRVQVMQKAHARNFLLSGYRHYRFIWELLAEREIDANRFERILDFGCGCGRVLRWWPPARAALHGCDTNGELTAWAAANLPRASVVQSDPLPPLPYPDEHFDLVYSISIFTHLPADRQLPWVDELARITRPGGLILLTLAGEAYRDSLRGAERRAYEAGRLAVRFAERPGSNLLGAFHPPAYVRDELLSGLEPLERVPGDPARDMRQDAYLIRRPLDWSPRPASSDSAGRSPGQLAGRG